ncbi:MAG: LptE family protein [Chitinophagaceae bacterium]
MTSTNNYTSVSGRKSKTLLYRLLPCSWLLLIAGLLAVGVHTSGCRIYSFRDVSIPDSIKTVKINFIENKASYVNPQLAQRLTDRLRQKIVSQTRLSQTNNDNADWIINATITGYSFSTSGISQQQEATNRLTITVHVIIDKQKSNETKEQDVSRSFEFSASQSIQQAETNLADEIVRSMTDDIFNQLFSEW